MVRALCAFPMSAVVRSTDPNETARPALGNIVPLSLDLRSEITYMWISIRRETCINLNLDTLRIGEMAR
jgi:hypothetical protein